MLTVDEKEGERVKGRGIRCIYWGLAILYSTSAEPNDQSEAQATGNRAWRIVQGTTEQHTITCIVCV